MADRQSYWRLVISDEPNGSHDSTIELSDADKEHIASSIWNDFTEGLIVQDLDDQLVWRDAGTGEPGDQRADSRQVAPDATSAYYLVGLDRASSTEAVSWWSVRLVQLDGDHNEIRHLCLGFHWAEHIAKSYAESWERHGTPDGPPREA